MKKDIEWLKKEIGTEMIGLESNRAEKWSDVKYQTLRSVAQKLDQLDEPEVLSQGWINDNAVVGLYPNGMGHVVPAYKLQSLLVPKQELPVVPAWFDEWWKNVSEGPGSLLHNIDRFCDELFSSGTREMYNYISTPDNKKKLLNIIINELDYKVEEEQKYYALIKGHELITGEGIWDCRYWNLSTSDGVVFPSDRFSRDDKLLTKMSKEDWNKCSINDSNADFVKVGEVEE